MLKNITGSEARMNRGRELLARAGLVIAQYRWSHPAKYTALHKLSQTINEYLEENFEEIPEVTRKPLSEEDMEKHHGMSSWLSFRAGVRFAEKYHGIGGEDE